ncbi:MAG: hypothetical protein HRU14_06215 [Planctomycetes bacterium]|nr:hypothetical protein [Planctomycetota bacterium]
MVRTQEPSDDEKLDRILEDAAQRHGLKLVTTGWSRKTYDVFDEDPESRRTTLLFRVESFATTSGEVTLFKQTGEACAREVAESLERTFEIEEAILIDRQPD